MRSERSFELFWGGSDAGPWFDDVSVANCFAVLYKPIKNLVLDPKSNSVKREIIINCKTLGIDTQHQSIDSYGFTKWFFTRTTKKKIKENILQIAS